ncbi:MAG TPA: low molecular weight protein arginine phosphatase [Longimicrobiales bacterium]
MTDQANAGATNDATTFNILFVCTGNTCRSPMAEAIARRMFEERGWTHVSVASAGIGAATGAPAAEHALRVAAEHGLDLTGHASRPLTPDTVAWADVILVMGPSHIAAVCEMGGADKVAMVTDFRDGEGLGAPIADPFGADEEAYRVAYDELEDAIAAVRSRLEPILSP